MPFVYEIDIPNHVFQPLFQCLFFHLINSADLNKRFILIKYVIKTYFAFSNLRRMFLKGQIRYLNV